MAEAAYRSLQLAQESSFDTEVDATTVFPADPGSGEFTLNRATEVPDEDYGRAVRNQTGRGSHGVRIATASLSAPARFEDVGHVFQMCIGSAVVTGGGTYVHTWTGDITSSTHKSYVLEVNDDTQDWIATGVVATGFELGFDTLGAGENVMWQISGDLQAARYEKTTATATQSPPATLQTIEGHMSQLYEGPAGTAYASLSELSGALVSYRLRVEDPKPARVYGGTADRMSGVGRGKRLCSVSAVVKLSSDAVTDFFDIYNVSGAVPTERRWRIKASGVTAAVALLTIDHKLLFKDVHIEPDGRDGERLMAIEAEAVYDATLASDLQIAVTNLVSALP